jgi:hypothetical protein
VAEVCLREVGAVAAREVSRFARNSREWQQLVEVCRVVDTVLIDLETVYSPRHSNDRLLLGLKGSLNEYELDLLRQRSVEARRAKARRGELLVAAAVGYLKTDALHVEKDPDRRVQEAIALVFRKFVELGTVRQTLWWFLEHGLQLPVRPASGELVWRRPSYGMLYRMLRNPMYGGAYAYGKTERTLHYEHGEPRTSSRRKPREQWLALIPHAHEGYVSWDDFERIQRAMAENQRGWGRTGAVTNGRLAALALGCVEGRLGQARADGVGESRRLGATGCHDQGRRLDAPERGVATSSNRPSATRGMIASAQLGLILLLRPLPPRRQKGAGRCGWCHRQPRFPDAT